MAQSAPVQTRQRRNAINLGTPEAPAILVNCDLCILSYQIYHQSAIWPVDPWYEILARGATDRRSLFKAQCHEVAKELPDRDGSKCYGGPAILGSLGRSNLTLDPIMTNYLQIRPRDPVWNGDGAVFIGIKTPAYITDAIRHVSVVHYSGAWKAPWPHGIKVHTPVISHDSGSDEMIAFEGGTGSYRGTEASWSLMGFVLKRTRKDGTWDAHIVFRGSRSGNAMRAVMKSGDGIFNGPEGNADWITDLASKSVKDPYVGGDASEGFAGALKRCWGTLSAALVALGRKHGNPASIQIAGHSLGGALASMCCASIAAGVPGQKLRELLPGWPWDAIQGYFYAVPPIGTEAYCNDINQRLAGRAVAPYVKGDPVVECSKSVSMKKTGFLGFAGYLMGSGGYSVGALDRLPRPSGCHEKENSHEIYLIRHAIITKYCQLGTNPIPAPVRSATAWATFATFRDMLEARSTTFVDGDPPAMVTRDNLRTTLVNSHFSEHFALFLKMLKDVVANPKGYRGYHKDSTYALAGERVALALEMCANIDSDDPAVIADTVATQVAALCAFSAKTELTRKGMKPKKGDDGAVDMEADDLLGMGFNTRIGLGLILRALQDKGATNVAHYERETELIECFKVYLGDVEKWQKSQSKKKNK